MAAPTTRMSSTVENDGPAIARRGRIRNDAKISMHLVDAIIHELLQQSVLSSSALSCRNIDQPRMIALVEMTILRIHHRCLSIADEILAQIFVE